MANPKDSDMLWVNKLKEAHSKEKVAGSELAIAAAKMVADGKQEFRIKTDAVIKEALRAGVRPVFLHRLGLGTSSPNRVYDVKKAMELEPEELYDPNKLVILNATDDKHSGADGVRWTFETNQGTFPIWLQPGFDAHHRLTWVRPNRDHYELWLDNLELFEAWAEEHYKDDPNWDAWVEQRDRQVAQQRGVVDSHPIFEDDEDDEFAEE